MADAYTEVYLQLQEQSIAYWGQTADVPNEVANEVAALMAWSRVNDHGVSDKRYQRLLIEMRSAEPMIRKMSVRNYRSASEPENF